MIETKAIVLKSTPFDESSKIVHLFTQDLGIISAVVKKISEKRLDLIQATTPLFEGKFHLKKTQSDLHKVIDISAISYHHLIKEDFYLLKSSFDILQLILKTQIKNRPLPLLYQLTSVYLNEFEKTEAKQHLLLSFYLKFLRHEGLFDLEHFCEGLTFDPTVIKILCYSTKFEEMYQIFLDEKTTEEIFSRFSSIIHNAI
jgi:DNA repair protein RecO